MGVEFSSIPAARLCDGRRRVEEVPFPAGWEVLHLRGETSLSPPGDGAFPAARSLPLPAGNVLVVVNDAQRATPTPWLLERFDCAWDDPRVRVAVATGSHAPPTPQELRAMLGPFHDAIAPRLIVHHAGADDTLDAGVTSRGTPVAVNRAVGGADAVLCLGSVEPHYFAGFTGGRKSLVPGLCTLETMRANHRLALEEGAAIGRLDANPLHLDLAEATALVRDLLARAGCGEPAALNAVVCRGVLHAWHFGPLLGTVETLAPRAREVFGREVPGAFPLVVCLVDDPLDRDLYQALKAFEHWKAAVAPGGTLLLVAGCRAGVGPPAFTHLLAEEAAGRPCDRRGRQDYRLGDHKLASLRRYLESGRRVALVSPALAAAGGLPLPVARTLRGAVEDAASPPSAGRRALLVEDAAAVYPLLPGPGAPGAARG